MDVGPILVVIPVILPAQYSNYVSSTGLPLMIGVKQYDRRLMVHWFFRRLHRAHALGVAAPGSANLNGVCVRRRVSAPSWQEETKV